MHQNQKLVEERIHRVLTERITPACYSARTPVTLSAWEVPDEPVPVGEALVATYSDFAVGTPWGRPWSTWWFQVKGAVPTEWAGRTVELVVDPGFQGDWPGNQAEGLVFTPDGVPVKGIHPRNMYVPIADVAAGGERVHFFMEAAANPDILKNDFVPTVYGEKSTAPADPVYTFATAELAVLESEVWALRFDIEVLYQLVKELPPAEPRRHEVLRALERALDVLLLDDIVGTAAAARAELTEVLARPANASAHVLSAVGHAHIDTAWLWPIRETKRKVGRTFSNVLALAERYPDFRFAASSAQQYAWIKERYPDIWRGIQAAVERGQWFVVGSQWIEPDGNLPGGEAMVRQLTQGLRFFERELGVTTKGIWMPDSFGYTAAFPQVAKLAGVEWFLTQKISWNQTNEFPHHTFWWEGIDGSRIFTHFPPADTYNSTLEGEEIHHAVREFREKGKATTSLVPFGYGDGGGGPIREMMERQRRVADLEGSPRVQIESPDEFFARARAEYEDAPVWVGELYLELHRGTFTSHAREKRGNRLVEHRLREAELWWTAAALGGADYPYDAFERLWQTTLLQQFHDILPGSSIAWVHRENEEEYGQSFARLDELLGHALKHLEADGAVVNAADHARVGLVLDEHGDPAGLVRVPGHGLTPFEPLEPAQPVTAERDGEHVVLRNDLVRVRIDARGLVTSIVDLRADRELVPAGRAANLLQLHQDLPNAWDAWDIDAHYRHTVRDLVELESIEVVEDGPLRARVEVVRTFGASRVTQRIALHADDASVHLEAELDWHEGEKLLKASLPFVVHAQHHSAEIQFGHLRRPTHTNTSWDDARFEVVAHRWVHVEEPGYGIGVVNAGTYGHDITRRVGEDGQVETEVRLSLVRAAKSPDPHQDQGHHLFAYAVVPGASVGDAVAAGYEMNLPLRLAPGTAARRAEPWSVVSSSDPGVRIEAVKLADDRSGDVVVRVYEALGRRAEATLSAGFDVADVAEVSLTERPLSEGMPRARSLEVAGRSITLGLRPFQIVTLRLARGVPHS
jgi:alpha-mannosidase